MGGGGACAALSLCWDACVALSPRPLGGGDACVAPSLCWDACVAPSLCWNACVVPPLVIIERAYPLAPLPVSDLFGVNAVLLNEAAEIDEHILIVMYAFACPHGHTRIASRC